MTIIQSRLEAVTRIARILDDFAEQEDVEAIVDAVQALVRDCECEDEDDDPEGTPKDPEEEEEDGPIEPTQIHCLKVVNS